MGTRTNKANFLKAVAEEGSRFFSQLDFVQVAPTTFWRKLGAVDHGFLLLSDPTPTSLSVQVGADVPALADRLDYVVFAGEHYATPIVSRPLGLLRRDGEGERTFYYFATVEELRTKFPQVYADFVEQAEPWLATLTTIDDVAEEFYKWRIAPPSAGEKRPPDPFAWAQYGWLLQEAGRKAQAAPWLERALDQLKEPAFYMKGRAFVPIGTPGAQPIPRRPEELRLIELLKKDLGVE